MPAIAPAPVVLPARLYTQFQTGAGVAQCEAKSAVFAKAQLKAHVDRLRAEGIEVVEASCGNTGLFYPAVCGGASGGLFLIEVKPVQSQVMLASGWWPTPEDRPPPVVLSCDLVRF